MAMVEKERQEEKRKYRRYRMDAAAAVETSIDEAEHRVLALQSEDISIGGIGLRTLWAFPNGTELAVRAILPNGEHIEVQGVVVRGTPWNMGVQFKNNITDLPDILFS